MPTLPTTGLTGTPVTDHILHHEELHKLLNQTAVSPEVGDTLIRHTTVDSSQVLWPTQPQFVFDEQRFTYNHTAVGPLTFAINRRMRALKINASADITGMTPTNITDLGFTHAVLRVLLVATANITVDLAGAIVSGGAPASMTAGESVPFELQWWDF